MLPCRRVCTLSVMAFVLNTKLKRQFKDLADLKAQGARLWRKAEASVKKALQAVEYRVNVSKTKGVCRACFYRAVGQRGGPAHSYERGQCKYRSRRVLR